MYANDLIEINGLSFGSSARLDDVYMEAITINLKDVTFPSASDVFLRTRDGEIAFGTFSSPTVGAANFTNVVHPDVSSSALTPLISPSKAMVSIKPLTKPLLLANFNQSTPKYFP